MEYCIISLTVLFSLLLMLTKSYETPRSISLTITMSKISMSDDVIQVFHSFKNSDSSYNVLIWYLCVKLVLTTNILVEPCALMNMFFSKTSRVCGYWSMCAN